METSGAKEVLGSSDMKTEPGEASALQSGSSPSALKDTVATGEKKNID